jgi:hypothetical protein
MTESFLLKVINLLKALIGKRKELKQEFFKNVTGMLFLGSRKVFL